ncbi:rifin PIR protein, putative [Plasmodium reichenowi]|uniref:Rifin PIR protein, putative n=1 Tax=Plasmodium reichenowi TaxID=5854 RepID=A0A2P9DEC1_PLARE|nr:rifin PIR protein, putative [Plasmodium reichenowi]
MKMHCSKILLFFLPLNILVSSSTYVYNKNKIYITIHHTQNNRSLCECDTQSSIYDKDAEIKSVKETFDRQTSQRFVEYEERMKEKRQKRKEQRDENIEQIIQKDKMEKSLAEKVEKGCLKCGCGLGGVAASVGLFGGLGIYGWEISATAAAVAPAKEAGAAAGMKILIDRLNTELVLKKLFHGSWDVFITTKNYLNETLIFERVKLEYQTCFAAESECRNHYMLSHYSGGVKAERIKTALDEAEIVVRQAVEKASEKTISVTESQMATVQSGELEKITATSYYSYSAIGYSVLAILIIVLVMIIIYLFLRYRRKKKMNKKAQYTKLLNQ